jgi:branched-chain amino acid transport system permease protein
MQLYVQYGVDAIGLGCLYALMSLALALLFGVMGLMNFAFGELIMIGAFSMYLLQDYGTIAIVLGVIGIVVIGAVLMELLAFRPVRHADPTTLLITSFALSVGLQQAARATIGPISKPVKPFSFLSEQVQIGEVRIKALDITALIVTIVLVAGLTLILQKTLLGIQLRASTEDFQMSTLLGVKANQVISLAFAITGVLAGTVAILLVAKTGSASYDKGADPVLIAFVGCVIGGLGSIYGAALGGFLLGATLNVLQSTLPIDYSTYTPAVAYLLVIVVLLVRPQGLVVRRTARV